MLLTVHLVMILGKWPTWRKILFFVFISILYMFRETSCSSSGESIVSIQPLVYVILCLWRFRVQVGKEPSDLHTKRSQTQSDTYQRLYWYNRFSWLWARGCSKHVQNWNKYTEKNCASIWSFTKKLKCVRHIVVTISNIKFHKNPSSGRKDVQCGQPERQKWRR
jgi:hypothetical protein